MNICEKITHFSCLVSIAMASHTYCKSRVRPDSIIISHNILKDMEGKERKFGEKHEKTTNSRDNPSENEVNKY